MKRSCVLTESLATSGSAPPPAAHFLRMPTLTFNDRNHIPTRSVTHASLFGVLQVQPHDQDLPFACIAGYLGSPAELNQSSPFCAGPCPAGTFCEAEASTATTVCPVGSFCPTGSIRPRLCPSATFGNATGLKSEQDCTACPRGHTCTAGSSAPTPCPAGLFAANGSFDRCEECDAGSVANDTGAWKCELCKEGEYQPLRGMSECRVCPRGSSSIEGATTCALCENGFYKNPNSDAEDDCSDCSTVDGIACPRNTTLSTIDIRQGYWRHSASTKVVYECRSGDNGRTPCAGGKNAGTNGDGYCAIGHKGPVCEQQLFTKLPRRENCCQLSTFRNCPRKIPKRNTRASAYALMCAAQQASMTDTALKVTLANLAAFPTCCSSSMPGLALKNDRLSQIIMLHTKDFDQCA
eukprot:3337445-Pleurochrysis_carterae.AAC.13